MKQESKEYFTKTINETIAKARKSVTAGPMSLLNNIMVHKDNGKVIDAVQEESSEDSEDDCFSNNQELSEGK